MRHLTLLLSLYLPLFFQSAHAQGPSMVWSKFVALQEKTPAETIHLSIITERGRNSQRSIEATLYMWTIGLQDSIAFKSDRDAVMLLLRGNHLEQSKTWISSTRRWIQLSPNNLSGLVAGTALTYRDLTVMTLNSLDSHEYETTGCGTDCVELIPRDHFGSQYLRMEFTVPNNQLTRFRGYGPNGIDQEIEYSNFVLNGFGSWRPQAATVTLKKGGRVLAKSSIAMTYGDNPPTYFFAEDYLGGLR